MVLPMGCCSGNLCLYRSGFSMSHIHHGSFLKRAVLLSLKSQMKGMSHTTATARLHTSPVSLTWNSCTFFPAVEIDTSQSLHTHMFMGMHEARHVLGRQYGFSAWRAFSSMSDASEMLIHGGQSVCEDMTSLSKTQAKEFVVVVESPTKAKTIEKYLGPDYVVLPTYGHVRDLAARAGSVRPDEDFDLIWEVPVAAHTHMSRIKQALKGAKCLILASDPDREGEAIAWHVSEVLKAEGILKGRNLKVVRVTFNEITKGSVLRAMQGPRDISSTLVTAYLARRGLDHLIGFALSPVLWRKLPGSKSAGRVQSVALKLVCEREKEIEEFVQQEFWTVEAYARRRGQESEEHSTFPVRPTHIDGKKIEKFSLRYDDAKSLSERLMNQPLKVSSVQTRSKRRSPPEPYITSTLQMDAQTKLGYGAVRTMTLAQKLYEGVKLENEQLTGLITYMRTDGLQLSSEAVKDIRALAAQRYGDRYVPIEYRKFNTKVKNAQEAHEAIRPTDIYRLPSQLVHVLEKDALLLYTLIWKRTVACQMEQAVYEEASANLVTEGESICLQAVSSFLSFPGFLAAMEDNHGIITTTEDVVSGESEQGDIDVGKDTSIFSLKKNDVVEVKRAESRQHFTRPPARFSEGLLVKAMEELGIGRPSTYATMLKTLESRNYVRIEQHRIIPEARGRMVAAFLSHYFPKYIDYDFTARLEEQLDEVSGGQVEWKEVLRGFWPEFKSVVDSSIKVSVQEVIEMLQVTLASNCFKGLGISGHTCSSCGQGKLMLKLSRFGSGYFFGCNRYPDCRFTAQLPNGDTKPSLGEEKDDIAALKMMEKNEVLLGLDPDTNLEVRVKKGPFGYYIQSGQEGKERRNFKIPEGVNPSDLTLEKARELMKFPLPLGAHPEDGKPVTLGIGKSSYYVRHGNLFASVPKVTEPHEVTLERAVDLLKGKTARRLGRKGKAVVGTKEKKRSPQQQERGRNAAVSRASVTKSISMEAADGDPKAKRGTKLSTMEISDGELEPRKIRRQRTVKIRAETIEEAAKPSVDSLEQSEPKARRLGRSKIYESVANDEKAKKTPVKKTLSNEVSTEAVTKSLNLENGSDETGKSKRGRKKAQIAAEIVEDGPKAKTRREKIVKSEEGERMTENVPKPSIDSIEEAKLKVERAPRQKKSNSVAADEKASNSMGAKQVPPKQAGLDIRVGSLTLNIEANEQGEPKLGRKSKSAVDENVQGDVEVGKHGRELTKSVSSNGRVRRSTTSNSTRASAEDVGTTKLPKQAAAVA